MKEIILEFVDGTVETLPITDEEIEEFSLGVQESNAGGGYIRRTNDEEEIFYPIKNIKIIRIPRSNGDLEEL